MTLKRREIVWLSALAILSAVVAVFWLSGVPMWSPINCMHYDVDIRSGRIRYTRYVAYMRVKEKIDESIVSRVIDQKEGSPEWRRALTFSPGYRRVSPHYTYHSAIEQIKTLDLLWKISEFTRSAQKESAYGLIAAWQRGNNDEAAKSYLSKLNSICADGKKIEEGDVVRIRAGFESNTVVLLR
jgi:hypothetical protein